MSALPNVSDNMQWVPHAGTLHIMEDSADEISQFDYTAHLDMDFTPELDILSLPSSLAPGEITRHSLELFAAIEAELR